MNICMLHDLSRSSLFGSSAVSNQAWSPQPASSKDTSSITRTASGSKVSPCASAGPHLLLVWGWGHIWGHPNSNRYTASNFFSSEFPSQMEVSMGKYMGKSSIYRANEVSPPGRRRESRLQLLFTGFVGEHGQNQPQSPGPWQGTHVTGGAHSYAPEKAVVWGK